MPGDLFAPSHILKKAAALDLIAAAGVTTQAVSADGTIEEKVRGYFCDAQVDQIAFLNHKARGENEIMAANAVNKAIAKASCAYYLPANAIPTGEHTVMKDGLVYQLKSFMFLPEKVERWSGTVLGSLQTLARDQDI